MLEKQRIMKKHVEKKERTKNCCTSKEKRTENDGKERKSKNDGKKKENEKNG